MKFFKGIPITLLYITIYTLAPVLISVMGVPSQYVIVIQLPFLALLFSEVLFGSHDRITMFASSGVNNLYIFYMFLCIVMFIRGYNINDRVASFNLRGALYVMFGTGLYILWTLIPLVVKRTYPHFHLAQFCKVGAFICAFFTLYTLFNLPRIMEASFHMAAGFEGSDVVPYARVPELFAPVMLCFAYVSTKERLVYSVCFAIDMLVLILLARRGALLMASILVVFMLLVNFRKMKAGMKILTICGVILIAIFGSMYVADLKIFTYLSTRGMDNTREGVNQALLAQMNSWEMVFGKGLNGSYYYPIFDDDIYDGWRYGCETGFLNIVLKGGLLMAIVYVLLLLLLSIKGIFKSNNLFCKGGGFYILWSLIYLYPFGVLDFDISFFFIWMWAMLCSRSEIRNMTDNEIKLRFFS